MKVSENNKWTLNDYSDDVIGWVSLSNIAEYSSPVHIPLIFRAYINTRPLYRRYIKTHALVSSTNKSSSMKNNSFIDLYRKEI